MSLPDNKLNQYGAPGLEVRGIVIHNTGNKMKASQMYDWLSSECQTSQGCHYLIDDEQIVNVMPENWKTWSTGKGNDYAFNYCLAIEICDCSDAEQSDAAEAKAVKFIKKLMKKYGLTKSELYYHIEFNPRTYCPHILLDKYQTKKNFVERNFK